MGNTIKRDLHLEFLSGMPKGTLVVGLKNNKQLDENLTDYERNIREQKDHYSFGRLHFSMDGGEYSMRGNYDKFTDYSHIFFVTKSNEIVCETEIPIDIKTYPEHKLPRYKKCLLVTGAHIYDGNTWVHHKIFIDNCNNCLELDNGGTVLYGNCYFLNYDFTCERLVGDPPHLLPFSKFKNFDDKPKGYWAIHECVQNGRVPSDEIDLCKDLLIADPFGVMIVNCSDGQVMLPLYLKPFFVGPPLFHCDGFKDSGEGKHDVKAASFRLLIKELLCLVLYSIGPKVEVMLENGMDINEWTHIANYMNIPIIIKLMEDTNQALAHFDMEKEID